MDFLENELMEVVESVQLSERGDVSAIANEEN
jgi:hypothetical protein